jgi:cysteine-rich repeat protein
MRGSTRKSTLTARKFRVGHIRVGLCVMLGAATVAVVAPAPGAGAVSGPVTLFTSEAPGFVASAATVPADVCFVTITADGGHGGDTFDHGRPFGGGGAAAQVSARVPVAPGDVLSTEVGGAGGDAEPFDNPVSGDGGAGGGAGGGNANGASAGGGGASAASSASSPVLVVAGGGGGASQNRSGGTGGLPTGGDAAGGAPGAGGLSSGVGGAGGVAPSYGTQGGGGGVSSGGDAHGGTGTGPSSIPSVGGGGGGGTNNDQPTGGAGGDAGSIGTGQGGAASEPARGGNGGAGNSSGGNGGTGSLSGSAGGGGGGIGFGGGGAGIAGGGGGGFGGGGGGGYVSGGGGGSSHVISTATSSSYVASARTGDGQVTITYDPATDLCAPTQIIVNVSGSQTYGSSPAFTATDNAPSGVLSGTVSCTTVNSGTAIASTLTAGGSYTIDGSSCSGLSASGNYTVTYVGVANGFVVGKAAQSLAFAPMAYFYPYGTASTGVAATATSGLPVTLSSFNPNQCTVSGTTVTFVKGGPCTIRADQAGDANWSAAVQISTVIESGGFVGDGIVQTPEQCDDGNRVSGDGCSATGAIEAARKPQTVTFKALGNKTYGASPFTVSAKATSKLPVTFASLTTTVCTVSGAKVTIVAAGLCTIRATQSGNSTWAAAVPVDRSFKVGFCIAKLFPPNKTKFTRGSSIPVVFQLHGSNGRAIPSSVASNLGCAVTVSFNGGTSQCATWIPGVNVFGALVNTPNNLTKAHKYPINVRVTIGSTVVASATTTVIAK